MVVLAEARARGRVAGGEDCPACHAVHGPGEGCPGAEVVPLRSGEAAALVSARTGTPCAECGCIHGDGGAP